MSPGLLDRREHEQYSAFLELAEVFSPDFGIFFRQFRHCSRVGPVVWEACRLSVEETSSKPSRDCGGLSISAPSQHFRYLRTWSSCTGVIAKPWADAANLLVLRCARPGRARRGSVGPRGAWVFWRHVYWNVDNAIWWSCWEYGLPVRIGPFRYEAQTFTVGDCFAVCQLQLRQTIVGHRGTAFESTQLTTQSTSLKIDARERVFDSQRSTVRLRCLHLADGIMAKIRLFRSAYSVIIANARSTCNHEAWCRYTKTCNGLLLPNGAP